MKSMHRVPVALVLAALLLIGCAQSGPSLAAPSSGALPPSAPASSQLPQEEDSTPEESASQPATGDSVVGSDIVWAEEGAYFEPFAPEEPPQIPQGTRAPVLQSDIDALLQDDAFIDWHYDMADSMVSYQYRFYEGNQFLASVGLRETDAGVFGHGTYRFLQEGHLEAMVWTIDKPEFPPSGGPTSPTYMTMQLEWAGQSREAIVVTLLTLEDTTPHQSYEQYFRNMVNVPIPFEAYP